MTLLDRFHSRYVVNCDTGCWDWVGSRVYGGYGSFRVSPKRIELAHRFSFASSCGPIPDGMFVLHSCDNRGCVNPAHLSLGTHLENMADMRAKGRSLLGPKHHNAKLSAQDINRIRTLRASGWRMHQIATEMGVSVSTVFRRLNDSEGWDLSESPRREMQNG